MGERVDHGVLHGGCAADGARLADPLRAERVERRRGFGAVHLEARELGRRRDGVVHEVAGERVAVGVVVELLVQRLAHPGGHPAVLLAFDEQRVEHGAAVVDGDVAEQLDRARCPGRPRRRRCALRTGTSPHPGRSRAVRRARSCRRRDRRRRPVRSPRRRRAPPSRGRSPGPRRPRACRVLVSTTMSATSASSRWAARRRALSTSASVARWTADPPICSDRDPPVPPPRGTRSVSLCTRRIRSTGMPVCALTIIANAV